MIEANEPTSWACCEEWIMAIMCPASTADAQCVVNMTFLHSFYRWEYQDPERWIDCFQGFTAKEWLNLKDDPSSPVLLLCSPQGQAASPERRALWPFLHDPSLTPYLFLSASSTSSLLLGWAVLQRAWALPAPGAAWFPGSCGRASFAWSSGSSWPAHVFFLFPLMTSVDSLKALVPSSSCESLLLSL